MQAVRNRPRRRALISAGEPGHISRESVSLASTALTGLKLSEQEWLWRCVFFSLFSIIPAAARSMTDKERLLTYFRRRRRWTWLLLLYAVFNSIRR